MADKRTELLDEVAGYYSGKLAEHGETARGVDWNGEESQALRFAQLSRIIDRGGLCSVNDLGCGYGALRDYLALRHPDIDYLGIDVSADMVRAAKRRHEGNPNTRFIAAAEPDRLADYSIASGIFNVRLERGESEWREYVDATIDLLDRTSRAGFAFNCLTSWSDADRKRDHLYYEDPCRLFTRCKQRHSRHVALLHDYGLYEFTLLVRKQP